MLRDFIEILILSAVQGISEFLPISSSAHLILVSNFYNLETSSLLIDISLHLGSLIAVIFYFRKELFDLRNNNRLLSLIIIGSLPLIFFGYILYSTEFIHLLRNTKVIASTEGKKSREVVEYGIEALKAVWHRGAVDAINPTPHASCSISSE